MLRTFDGLSREDTVTPVALEVTWGEGSRWISGSLHRGEGRHHVQVFGRLDDVTPAPTRLFELTRLDPSGPSRPFAVGPGGPRVFDIDLWPGRGAF